MRRAERIYIASLGSILLLLAACSYRVEKQPEDSLSKISGASLGFAEVQTFIFEPKCARCHQGEWPGDYAATKAILSNIAARIRSSDPGFMMPPPNATPLSDQEKAAVLDWIARGAPQNAEPAPVPPQEENPALTFANVSLRVLQPKCLRCHKSELDTFDHVLPLLKEIEFRVQAIGQDEQMPPARASQLTESEKTLLLHWIRAGAPLN